MDDYYVGFKKYYFNRILQKIVNIGDLANRNAVILDFGCGLGKLKKILGNKVINYDIVPELSEISDWKKVYFDIMVANEVFYLFNNEQLITLLADLRNHNPKVELVIGVSRQGLFNKCAVILANKRDAHDNTLLPPKDEIKILTDNMEVIKRDNVFHMCDIYRLKFK